MTSIIDKAQIKLPSKDGRIHAIGLKDLIPGDTKGMIVPFAKRQSGMKRCAEQGRRVLTDAAAKLKLGTIIDDRIALYKPIALIDRANSIVKRELFAWSDQN